MGIVNTTRQKFFYVENTRAFVRTRSIPYLHLTSSVSRWLLFLTPNYVILTWCTFSNHCEVSILSIKSLATLKDQRKRLVYKMFINEIDFQRLFDSILKDVL